MASEIFEEIVETFEFLDGWEDRYGHVIDMGKAMPEFDDALRVPATKVDGCASQVWLHATLQGEGPDAILTFVGDSDAAFDWLARLDQRGRGRLRRDFLDPRFDSLRQDPRWEALLAGIGVSPARLDQIEFSPDLTAFAVDTSGGGS